LQDFSGKVDLKNDPSTIVIYDNLATNPKSYNLCEPEIAVFSLNPFKLPKETFKFLVQEKLKFFNFDKFKVAASCGPFIPEPMYSFMISYRNVTLI
jgi:hypothetical protein